MDRRAALEAEQDEGAFGSVVGDMREGVRVRAMDRRLNELVVSHHEWNANGVSASIALGGRVHPVSFVASEGVGREVDFLLPLTLHAAMVTGSHLKLPGLVSSRLFSAVPQIQDTFRLWSTKHKRANFQRVPVDVEVRNGPADRASGVACFFSGGVDSFYTLLKHRDEITHLILVHGFDISLKDRAIRAQASHMAREVAREMDKPLLEVETDLRSFLDPLVDWNMYHGAALASVALLFQHRFHKVLIAATHSYADPMPWGSHPLLDPLWSTELTEIEHEGCEATRVEKAAYISENELAMKWLRVCWENPNSAYNCGSCEKCLRTMVNLRAAGAQERCKTLSGHLDLKAVANVKLSGESDVSFARENLNALERLGTEPDLARALKVSMSKSRPDRIELKQVRTQLAQLRTRHAQLRPRHAQLRLRLSSRRYKLTDVLVDSALKIPGVGKLVRWKKTPPTG